MPQWMSFWPMVEVLTGWQQHLNGSEFDTWQAFCGVGSNTWTAFNLSNGWDSCLGSGKALMSFILIQHWLELQWGYSHALTCLTCLLAEDAWEALMTWWVSFWTMVEVLKDATVMPSCVSFLSLAESLVGQQSCLHRFWFDKWLLGWGSSAGTSNALMNVSSVNGWDSGGGADGAFIYTCQTLWECRYTNNLQMATQCIKG